MKIPYVWLVSATLIICGCSPQKKYSDFEECLNEETKSGAIIATASDYCRRFVTIDGEGAQAKPYQTYKDESGATFIKIDSRKVILEQTATNPKTGERLGLVGESWVRIK